MTQGEPLTLGDIARHIGAELTGDAGLVIVGLANLRQAEPGQLSFLFSPGFRRDLPATRASAVVLKREDAGDCPAACLIVDDPRLSWAKISPLFDPAPAPRAGVHPSAIVGDSVTMGADVSIGPNAVIGDRARIGDRVVIGAGSVVGAESAIGDDSRLWSNVTLYHGVVVGRRAIIHSGAVLGADGFGFAFDPQAQRMSKIHQIYGVVVGDDVEIGAGTTIDRGALNDTVIGNGVKMDNQVQIGHNVVIGDHTVISGCTAVAGSTKVGRYCLIGGGVGIIDNIEVTDRVEIVAMTLVTRSIDEPGRYASGTGLQTSSEWRRNIVGFKKLYEMQRRLAELERRLVRDDDKEE